MEMFHFVTNWRFQAPIEEVCEELIDVKSWLTWWPGWRKAVIRGSEVKLQSGSVVDNEVRGALLYSLRFTTEVTVFQPPQLFELRSSGDLVGMGRCVLEQQDNVTAVTYYWDVGASNPIFNLLGKLSFIRKMLEKNHSYVMDEGFRGLKQRLEQ